MAILSAPKVFIELVRTEISIPIQATYRSRAQQGLAAYIKLEKRVKDATLQSVKFTKSAKNQKNVLSGDSNASNNAVVSENCIDTSSMSP